MSDIFDEISASAQPKGDIFDKVSEGDIFDRVAPEQAKPVSAAELPTGFFERRSVPDVPLGDRIMYWAKPPVAEEKPDRIPELRDKPSISDPFKAQALRSAEALNRGLSMFSGNLNALSQYVSAKTGLDSGGGFEKAAKFYAENADYWNKKAEEVGTNVVDDLIGEAIGGSVPGIAEFMLSVPYASLLGAAEAEKAGNSEAMGAITEGAKRYILGKILHATNILKQPYRSGAMGGVFGAQTAIEGGSPEEIAKGVGTGMLYGIPGSGRMGLRDVREGLVKTSPKMPEKEGSGIEPATLPVTPEKPGGVQAGKTVGGSEGVVGSEKGGSAVKLDLSPVDAVAKEILPRQTKPLITTEQRKRIAKKKAVKEQQLQIESAEDAKKAVHSMIRERRNRLNLASYETNLFCNEIEQSASRRQREVIPFIIEDTEVPKGLNRPDLEEIYSKDRANLKPIAQQVKKHFDEGWQKMKEHAPEMSAQQIEDYVTHIWDIPKGQKRMVSNWFTTQNRFLKKRFIETINEGVEKFGLQPKTLDIAEIIRVHDSIMNRVIENNRFVKDLNALKKDGVPLMERADKAPQNWVYFDHPALRRGLIIPGEARMGEKVSPELADLLTEMGVAIGRRISPKAFGKPVSKTGEYRPGETPEVRFQRFMSNRTIAHEIGHHIDETLKLGDSFLDKYKTELYAINKDRIESFIDPKKKAYAVSTEEQIAEFFATLFTKPDKAKQLAPTATVDVLERLKQDGVLSRLIDFDFEKNAKNLIEEQLSTMVKLPVKVHPDLEKPLKVIFDSRIDHPVLQAYETANGILKKTKLSISLFHHMALGETAISTMGLKKTAGIYFNPVKIYKAMVQGKFDIYQKEPIARDAVSHGLQVGATADIPVNMIQTKLNNLARMSKSIPVVREATAFLRTFNEAWDKALWNYLHDTLKLHVYEHLSSRIDPTKDIKLQKQEIAQFVNDTFGGQNWDTLMVSPKSLQLMSWSLLSPDWTLSTLRQALAPTGIGKLHKETAGLRKKMGKHFWIKAALYFGVGINMLNYAYRKKDEEEHPEYYQGQERSFMDRTMAGNAIGHKTHLFVGRYDDGTERYIRWGKQFRELPEMFFDDTGFCPLSASLKKIGGKLSPVIQHTFDIFTGVSPSGFRNEDIYGKAGWDRAAGIAKSIMKAPLPFSSRSLFQEGKEFHLTDVAMPSSKGMTRYRSMELFKLAIAKGDERMLKEVYQETLRNNLPAYTLFGAALTSLKAESTKELSEGLKTVADIQEQLRHAKSPADAERLRRRFKRIQKENLDRKAGLALLDAAIMKVEKYKMEEDD